MILQSIEFGVCYGFDFNEHDCFDKIFALFG